MGEMEQVEELERAVVCTFCFFVMTRPRSISG